MCLKNVCECRTYDDDEDDLIAKAFDCALKMNANKKRSSKSPKIEYTGENCFESSKERSRYNNEMLGIRDSNCARSSTVLMIQLPPKIWSNHRWNPDQKLTLHTCMKTPKLS